MGIYGWFIYRGVDPMIFDDSLTFGTRCLIKATLKDTKLLGVNLNVSFMSCSVLSILL